MRSSPPALRSPRSGEPQPQQRLWHRIAMSIGAVLVLVLGVLTTAPGAARAAGASGPCDIYSSAETPCVAAHSTVRAL